MNQTQHVILVLAVIPLGCLFMGVRALKGVRECMHWPNIFPASGFAVIATVIGSRSQDARRDKPSHLQQNYSRIDTNS